MTYRFNLLASTIALSLFSTLSIAQDFSQTVFFGDSLTDSGVYGAKFTTNPDAVWSETLATSYQGSATPFTQGGTNYAMGGAVTATVSSTIPQALPASTQIANYLSQNQGTADPKALYSVWIGANDLIAAASSSSAQTTIATAATNTVNNIQTLANAGAKSILVPNLPDVGLTPKYVGTAGQSTATQGAWYYNTVLFNGLNKIDANVIPANSFALIQEGVNNPTAFGFTNATGKACTTENILECTSTKLVESNANETYIFADGIHPSGRTHRILAQYYRSIIDSPAEMLAVQQQTFKNGVNTQQQLHRRLDLLDREQNNVWIDADVAQIKNEGSKSSTQPSVMVGADVAVKQHNVGLFAQYQNHQDTNVGNVQADSQETGLGVYHRYQGDNVQVHSHAGINHVSLDTQRQINWDGEARQHQASTTGQRAFAGLEGQYQVKQNKWQYAPYVAVKAQRLQLNDSLEDQSNLSTAMKFHGQTFNSLQGEVGVKTQYQMTDATAVYGQVGFNREFEDTETAQITASLPSMPNYSKGFNTTVENEDKRNHAMLDIGVKHQFSPAVSLNGGVATRYADSQQHHVGAYLGLQGQF